MKLTGTGNKDGRFFYIFDKSVAFFSLFPKFLLGCGFQDLGVYESYQEKLPALDNFENKIQNFKNADYDIDIIYTHDKIILIIRIDKNNRENLISGMSLLFL